LLCLCIIFRVIKSDATADTHNLASSYISPWQNNIGRVVVERERSRVAPPVPFCESGYIVLAFILNS
jgi:hypothetical protein